MGTTKTRKARLSHDLIVQTALAFIDENGIDQLNMRALAARPWLFTTITHPKIPS